VARINTNVRTYEGAPAYSHLDDLQQLRRSVLSCLLWEDEFYEDGKSIADRIQEFAAKVNAVALAELAIEARSKYHLRHVPLLLLRCLIKRCHEIGAVSPGAVARTVAEVVQRPDEMGELLAMYWADSTNKHMLPNQLRNGLQLALRKFDEYALAKYDRDTKVKLRDVLRLARPKPADDAQSALFGRAVTRQLETPDTWEVALSAGADKKETFERLLNEHKLGYLALLRNLRNMAAVGCDPNLVNAAILERRGGAERVLPFRYIAAARAAPQFIAPLDVSLRECLCTLPSLPGRTAVLVDVSSSMDAKLSGKSDLSRMDAAAALAALIPGYSRAFTFSNSLVEVVGETRGLMGIDAILRSQSHQGTYLGNAVTKINGYMQPEDRLIVISDEQAHDVVPDPVARHAYMINVASYRNGVGYGEKWIHLDGFSENVIRWIHEFEQSVQ
jgi:hypothetical protein